MMQKALDIILAEIVIQNNKNKNRQILLLVLEGMVIILMINTMPFVNPGNKNIKYNWFNTGWIIYNISSVYKSIRSVWIENLQDTIYNVIKEADKAAHKIAGSCAVQAENINQADINLTVIYYYLYCQRLRLGVNYEITRFL